MNSNHLDWYLQRLRAMSPREVALHLRKRFRQFTDASRERDWTAVKLDTAPAFPLIPLATAAPEILRQSLRRDADAILAGRWRAFGHLELQVDDPPRWQRDYLVGKELATTQSAFKLNHRSLPDGADIKLIWELSRWHALVRLAMAAHVLGDERAGEKCVLWLEDWVKHNPPFHGWNWTSALESGMRLIQFTWIDALLAGVAEAWGIDAELDTLRHQILPPHAWFTWRHQSFGSSANNHLLGELAGLIAATVRWPALENWGAPIMELQRRWEREVLAQFAEDGGNREQALNYQLFAWELCWQARLALVASGRRIADEVDERLRAAAGFFVEVQVPSDSWDYGDSDSAFVAPFFADDRHAVAEWHAWLGDAKKSPAIACWLGESPVGPVSALHEGWSCRERSGQVVWRGPRFTVRYDVSPLGYLKPAAHGHLDALHLSLWLDGIALVVDPGTGCYYAESRLRTWLASRAAHNGPSPDGLNHPRRLGPFLWGPHDDSLLWTAGEEALDPAELRRWYEESTGRPLPPGVESSASKAGALALLELGDLQIERRVTVLTGGNVVEVDDMCRRCAETRVRPFTVRWQFAPGTGLESIAERRFRATRGAAALEIEISGDWADIMSVQGQTDCRTVLDSQNEFDGIVSPSFRRTVWAPCLKLVARPESSSPARFQTRFSLPN